MRRFLICCFVLAGISVFSVFSAEPAAMGAKMKSKPAVETKPAGTDTLVMDARLIEIPGKFAPNDLYDYVYIMKYRVVKVVKGTYAGKEILVGHYDPLIPRSQIKDKMATLATGNVSKFEEGQVHRLTVVQPISLVWNDAIQDDYFTSEQNKYYALKTDLVK
jgi:hypothetical protein